MKECKLEEYEKLINSITQFSSRYLIINLLTLNNPQRVTPFKKELEKNLLGLSTKEEKRLLIRYYISKLLSVHNLFEPIEEHLNPILQSTNIETNKDIIDKSGNKRDLANSEIHILKSYKSFLYIIYEIHQYSIIDEIDLNKIFTDLNIPTTYITDNWYTNSLFRNFSFKSHELDINLNRNKQTIQSKNNKSFPEYLDYDNPCALAEALKNEFTGKGKELRLILEVLKKHNIFSFGYRKKQAIYDAMTQFFSREIGSKQSIFDCKIIIDDPDFKVIETTILNLLETIESNK